MVYMGNYEQCVFTHRKLGWAKGEWAHPPPRGRRRRVPEADIFILNWRGVLG